MMATVCCNWSSVIAAPGVIALGCKMTCVPP
jgi:hypothetical protein